MKRSIKGNMGEYHREFIKILESIKPGKHLYETFSDWLVIASASLYSWKKDKAVEEEYAEAAKAYTPKELDKHGELLLVTVDALEDMIKSFPGCDFLGEVFTAANLGSERNGQFFTPYIVSYMMAKMMYGNGTRAHGRVEMIEDPCCGAGGMLVAGAMAIQELDVRDYQKDYLYVGQDIDSRCARMAFIQTSLMGLPAVITHGDSLTNKIYWRRETIGYHLSGMDFRLRAERVLDLIAKAEGKKPEPEQAMEINLGSIRAAYVQGELFAAEAGNG
jgi:type I restriction-modification system DNA methylase subunit